MEYTTVPFGDAQDKPSGSCIRRFKNAITLYNQVRLSLSLDFKTPDMVYKLTA
ncbi:hypothetical protein ACG2LH_08420 [Zhouia sp. PK063]|uniref:hypothetical protein n=1 Tax=Zhouia sp. PK063 TaxID=3373602 RepID=UPI0037B513DD